MFLILFSLIAWASGPEQFSGHWQGKGIWVRGGVQKVCSLVKMEFHGTPEHFQFSSGERICEDFQQTFDREDLDIRGEDVLYQGQLVGHLKDNLFSLEFIEGGERVYRMSMRREGNRLSYEESMRLKNESTPLLSFVGVLEKSEER